MDQTLAHERCPAADFNRALACTDPAAAFDHLLVAARGGCLRAQFLVGLAYHTGRGVAVDFERAAAWYREAACGGDSYAIANLGVMSLMGQGAPRDDVDAYTWIRSAAGLGHGWLRPIANMLERRIAVGSADPISVSPETPAFAPCTHPSCDHSRCNVA